MHSFSCRDSLQKPTVSDTGFYTDVTEAAAATALENNVGSN